MRVIAIVASAILLEATAGFAQAPAAGGGDAGKTAWARTLCVACHGANGEGGFGPDLAGRGLTFSQFQRAVRQPWGIMPAFTEEQLPAETLQRIHTYLSSLPRVGEPGEPRSVVSASAPHAQQLWVNTFGCSQCHGPEMGQPRRKLGGEVGADPYATFAKLTYNHTDVYPKGMMGNFSRARLPETVLREMYDFLNKDLGLRVPVTAVLSPPSPAAGGSQYTLTVKNTGSPGGLAAQDLTIALLIPSQAKIVATTGPGYAGVVDDPELKANAATWRVKKLTAGETLTYTLTLPQPVPDAFKGSVVRWMKPEIRRPANLALNPKQGGLGIIPDKGDGVTVAVQAPKSTD